MDLDRRHVPVDAAIFSLPTFAQKLPIPKFLIYPSIDPLSDKNRELNRREVASAVIRENHAKRMEKISDWYLDTYFRMFENPSIEDNS